MHQFHGCCCKLCAQFFSCAVLNKGDEKKSGEAESDDEESDDGHIAYVSTISRKSMIGIQKAGATRVLRSVAQKQFPPTEMINASAKENGTYKCIDIEQKVAYILNRFSSPKQNKTRRLFVYTDTCAINHLHGCISYTAEIKWGRFMFRPSRRGMNAFWETGYVGELEKKSYYSTEENTRRVVALVILVDYYAYRVRYTRDVLPLEHNWTAELMEGTTKGDNFVVLAENRGIDRNDDHLFCIIIRHGDKHTVLIPREKEFQPWKEVEFNADNYSKRPPRSQDE
jgi:hypothetical protein